MVYLEPILAVDDSAPIRDMIVTMLAPRGYRIATAANGREALRRLRAATGPYILLLDIVMPVLGGLGLCEEIERDERLRAAGHKIILMSSTARLSAPEMPVTAGRLAKPFTRQQLIAAIEALRQWQP
ncbi:MAG TPA: response regulator [Ktedonobacterales bacterium]|nr:response regulator [Ktedonobacterales bacterium]